MSLKDIDRKNLTRLVKKLAAVKVTRIQATYKKKIANKSVSISCLV